MLLGAFGHPIFSVSVKLAEALVIISTSMIGAHSMIFPPRNLPWWLLQHCLLLILASRRDCISSIMCCPAPQI